MTNLKTRRRPSERRTHATAGSSRELEASPPATRHTATPATREPGKEGEHGPRQRRGEPAALYLRVSTREQSTDNQRPELEQLAQARGYDVVGVYEEQASAAGVRPEFRRMLADAHRGRFRVLLVWALDRFGRSHVGNMQDVLDLDHRGVQVVSFREAWLDTAGPTRGLLVSIFSWVAEQEREQLIARTRAGLERARRKGVRLGRPRVRIDVAHAQRMLDEGMSLRRVAEALDVSHTTLARNLRKDTAHAEEED